ncbi:hypothetical protein ORF058 [Pseudomonas phage PA11]|uniref:hypothetical protein ORF058 n=1 Tax=Pseudomonas phage PA11 TaxID=347327 RepID=UPI00015543B4|nr:hypothetical protein ORF058 [Pseudomonas phage PA11]
MAGKYFYWISISEGEVKPGFYPISDAGKYDGWLGVDELAGKNLAIARDMSKAAPRPARILRFNRKTLEFVGVVK